MYAKILPKSDIKDSLPNLRNMIIVRIQQLVLCVISRIPKQFHYVLHCFCISPCQHARDILCHKEKRLLTFEYSNVIKKELPSRVIYSA